MLECVGVGKIDKATRKMTLWERASARIIFTWLLFSTLDPAELPLHSGGDVFPFRIKPARIKVHSDEEKVSTQHTQCRSSADPHRWHALSMGGKHAAAGGPLGRAR